MFCFIMTPVIVSDLQIKIETTSSWVSTQYSLVLLILNFLQKLGYDEAISIKVIQALLVFVILVKIRKQDS